MQDTDSNPHIRYWVGLYALAFEVLAFCVISARCGWVYITTSPRRGAALQRAGPQTRQQNPRSGGLVVAPSVAESAGEGAGARRSVQGMVSIACFTRAALTVAVLMRETWVPYLAVPDVIYLATYVVLCSFLARQLHISVAGTGGSWHNRGSPLSLKLVATGGLVGVLVVSLVVCTLRWGTRPESKKSLVLRKWLCYELGVTYLMLFVALAYSGTRICITTWGLSKHAFYRMLLLTAVCGLALLSKGAFFVAVAANNWRTEALFPSIPARYNFEAVLALEELLPSFAMLVLTEKRKIGSSSHPRRPPNLSSESSGIGSESSGNESYMSSPRYNTSFTVSRGPMVGPCQPSYGSTLTAAYHPV